MSYVSRVDPNIRVTTYGYSAVDLPVALTIKYIGAQVAAQVSVAATTGDLTFESGATTAAATTTTETCPVLPVGGTAGIIDASDSEADTLHKIKEAINLAPGWMCWLTDQLPDEATEITAANAMYLTAYGTDNDCTVDGGFKIKVDTSLKTAEDFCVGVTWNNQLSDIHGTDIGVTHEVLEVEANVTYGGASDGIYVYEVNDILGTKVQIDKLPLTTATLTYFPTGGANGVPMWAKTGRRLVFKALDGSGAITPVVLLVRVQSRAIYPVVRTKNTWSAKSI